MLRGRDIVCISSIDWGAIWQGHQEIMSRLAAAGNRVIFVEFTGVRRPGLRDLPRLVQRLRNWRRSASGSPPPVPSLTVLSPLALPFPYARVALSINTAMVGRSLARMMVEQDFRRPIAWSFLPTPLTRGLIRVVHPRISVYHCVDDFSSSSPQAERIRESEEALLRETDLVFVTSERLRERAARFNPHVHYFPSGVDVERFEAARLMDGHVPEDMAELPQPIVGYIGVLHQWLDLELLCRVVDALPDTTFVFVGPVRADVRSLLGRRNVRLLGSKPHDAVPHYVKAFSVALIPYRRTDYTDHVYPAKLNEYLAMGVPVVSTNLPEVRRFNADHGEPVAIAADAEAFVTAIRRYLAATNTSEDVARRVAVARSNGWQDRLERMCALIEDAEAAKLTAAGARLQ